MSATRLPTGTASRLAAAADAVAVALDRGDGCLAEQRASQLAAQEQTAIASGQVPPVLEPELRRRVQALSSAIHCAPPPPSASSQATTLSESQPDNGPGDAHDPGRHGKGHKGKGKSDQ